MSNFRDGFLSRGYPLGKLVKTIELNTDTPAVDMTGYQVLLVNSPVGNNAPATSSGAGPYTITVTGHHGLSSDDDVEITFAGDWTTDANAIPAGSIADITVVDSNTFTYEVPTDPGLSGVINWIPLEPARTLTLLPSTLIGHTVNVTLYNGPNNQPTQPNVSMLFIDDVVPFSVNTNFSTTTQHSNITLMWLDGRWAEISRTIMAT